MFSRTSWNGDHFDCGRSHLQTHISSPPQARLNSRAAFRIRAEAPGQRYRYRQLQDADVPQTAALCLEVRSTLATSATRCKMLSLTCRLSSCFQAFGVPEEGLSLASRPRTLAEWEKQLASALASKLTARRESRIHRLTAQARDMRAQLAAMSAEPRTRRASPARPVIATSAAEDRAQLAIWRRKRTFWCLVAEERCSGEIAACVALSLGRPQAALPPPFPSSAPLQCYVSNMAVAPGHRRKGLAGSLLARCERLARVIEKPSVWLHVDNGNEAASQLYKARGYAEVGGVQLSWGMSRRRLLYKELPPLACRGTELESGEAVSLGSIGTNGVFLWDVERRNDLN